MIFKQAFRVAFVALVWKQYKTAIISTALLLIYLLLVRSVHLDYLAATSAEAIDARSFIYKWCAYGLGFACYFGFHIVRSKIKISEKSTKDLVEESKELTDTNDDPFAAIRVKKRLRSRADFIMEDDTQKKN